ncbi:class I SAM-dependent methyltransferase [Acetoanaerobium sticklandii]|uniref:class I SAM-dependent methyltransferase n=1 Tax=Acetoanaerobium sticklandii TaxID=1511 RepID=UPI003A8D225A
MGELLKKVEEYWDNRSQGYSEMNLTELEGFKMNIWRELINKHKPEKMDGNLKVLDIGTGPGFFAITMALCGYDVTAVDYTHAMLDKARYNAKKFDVNINFMQMDAHDLIFEDESFDLVVTRNLTWNLEKPDVAYKEWNRVLSNGGRLLNFDANWYLHLYDEERRAQYEQDRINSKKENVNDHYVNTDTTKMEEIARNLPLSKTMRPQWDAAVLINNGYSKIMIEQNIGKVVWDEEEQINYASTPMFMIMAEK